MPIYEYRCPKCNKVFEEWCPHITEDHPKEPCPDCGAISPRIISNTSFVLEGGGWYVTDYGYRKGIKDETSAPSHGTSGASHAPARLLAKARPRLLLRLQLLRTHPLHPLPRAHLPLPARLLPSSLTQRALLQIFKFTPKGKEGHRKPRGNRFGPALLREQFS